MAVDSALPGENGFHNRDGSLTKKKKEQWQLEKGIFILIKYILFIFLEESKTWFPFGTPNTRSNFRHGSLTKSEASMDNDKDLLLASTQKNKAPSTDSTTVADEIESKNKISIASTSFPTACPPTAFLMPGVPLINGVHNFFF